ncbi:branched-chain amino acid ABC transporter permease, partial [Mesorhizobium sp. M7A.T.Ca.TU.009.01.1.1]
MPELTLRETSAKTSARLEWTLVGLGILALLVAPFLVYPIFLMKMLCFALFACAFNLLL